MTDAAGAGATPISGTAYSISAGGYTAEIASVGATLRVLRHEGSDLIVPFQADDVRPAMRGAVLAPWPNRTANGRYEFDGELHQLPINELETRNAVHGLVAWLDFRCVKHTSDRLVLSGHIVPQPGYPWRVRIDTEFRVTHQGFRQRITATNESLRRAPFGMGVHPYLVAGEYSASALDSWHLEVRAADVLLTSPDRLLPTELLRVDDALEGMLDFRRPRVIGATALNHAFTTLLTDTEDAPMAAVVRLTGGDGHGVELSLDSATPWLQLYTSDWAPAKSRRNALAVEPMTCPPDALNSGSDLRLLEPAESTTLEWRLRTF